MFENIIKKKSIFLRKESIKNEYRTPLVPGDVQTLISNGFKVYVESSESRIYSDFEYEICGAIITTSNWTKFSDSLIIGLKELDNLNLLNSHTHLYFSHSFLNQTGSTVVLDKFSKSKSILYDLEYFLDSNNKRLVTFGFWAGFVGMALGLMQFYLKSNYQSLEKLEPWVNINQVFSTINSLNQFNKINQNNQIKSNPKIALIGYKGNCGRGVSKLLSDLSLDYTVFDSNSDKSTLISYDIIINCIKLKPSSKEIWFDQNTLFTKPIIIVDVSCDYTKSNNPIKLYFESTTWSNPVFKYNEFVDIISIDNLPSLLPKESSDEFSKDLTKLLLDYKSDPNKYWLFNFNIFISKINNL